jgi:hypothetical protein
VQELACTKVTLAEVEGALTAARRAHARIKDEAALIKGENAAVAEERDKAWEEVGSLMVQLHVLQNKNAELRSAMGMDDDDEEGGGAAEGEDEEEEDEGDSTAATTAATTAAVAEAMPHDGYARTVPQ